MFGENPTLYTQEDNKPLEYERNFTQNVLYVLSTNLLNVICLNILISIVTDNYDNVMQKFEATDALFKLDLILNSELLILVYRSWFGKCY